MTANHPISASIIAVVQQIGGYNAQVFSYDDLNIVCVQFQLNGQRETRYGTSRQDLLQRLETWAKRMKG